jgi:hypothetical protein
MFGRRRLATTRLVAWLTDQARARDARCTGEYPLNGALEKVSQSRAGGGDNSTSKFSKGAPDIVLLWLARLCSGSENHDSGQGFL